MPVLALDSGSPTVSVAVAADGEVLAIRTVAQRGSGAHLLRLVEEALAAAGVGLDELSGVVALRGPGSFTGLRIGLATALGLHQARGLPATGLSTLEVLAAAAPAAPWPILAAVAAVREEWLVQPFAPGEPPRALAAASRLAAANAPPFPAGARGIVGFDLPAAWGAAAQLLVPQPLAAVAALGASRRPPTWDASLLSRPLYLAPPPASLPGAPKPVLGTGGAER